MSVQTVIKYGTIVSPRGSRRGHLIVDGGVIAGIAEHDGDLPAAETVIDATGLHVLPGPFGKLSRCRRGRERGHRSGANSITVCLLHSRFNPERGGACVPATSIFAVGRR